MTEVWTIASVALSAIAAVGAVRAVLPRARLEANDRWIVIDDAPHINDVASGVRPCLRFEACNIGEGNATRVKCWIRTPVSAKWERVWEANTRQDVLRPGQRFGFHINLVEGSTRHEVHDGKQASPIGLGRPGGYAVRVTWREPWRLPGRKKFATEVTLREIEGLNQR